MLDDFSQLPRVDENQRRKLGISNASSIFAPWERTGKKKYGSYAGPYLVTLDEYLSPPHEVSVIARYLKEDINMHWHDFLELEYVSSGDGVHYLNQQIVPFSAGSLHLLLPTDFHEIHVNPNDYPYVFSVKFPETLLDRDMFNMIFQNNTVRQVFLPEELRPSVLQDFIDLDWEYRHGELFRAKAMNGLLQQILIKLERLVREQTQQGRGEVQQTVSANAVIQAMAYIRKNFARALTLKDISQYVHLSPNYLSSIFRQTVGCTISEYTRNVRMRHAIVFLLNQDKTILQICEEVGYNSYEHFERIFRRQFGVSPKEFRKRVLTNHSAFKGEDDCLPLSGYWRYEHGKDQT